MKNCTFCLFNVCFVNIFLLDKHVLNFVQVTDCELIPGGRSIRVTEENKHKYVDRVVEHRLTTAIRPQINAFMEGFGELIPRDLISIFNDKELELLISGLPDIDCEYKLSMFLHNRTSSELLVMLFLK